MRNSAEVANELNEKVYEVLRRGYERKELTVLMPTKEFNELLLINNVITYENIIHHANGQEVITVVGVTVKPIDNLDRVYVCL